MRIAFRTVSLLLLLPTAPFAADMHLRFARLTLAEGRVEVEQPATGKRMAAERNLPVGQGFWVETFPGARTELELDEGSLVRLGAGSLAELSDLTRLSTGQRISLVSLERGVLYATAGPKGLDAFVLVAPGLEITFLEGSRVRVGVNDQVSTVAVLEGRVRFSSRAAELELRQGQTVVVHPEDLERFQLFREVSAGDLDRWNEQRDREAAENRGELEAAGKWIDAAKLGKVWQPRVPEGWKPFRAGKWRWYEGQGYTWISAEGWGWLPYHYGRWALVSDAGWVWAPDPDGNFHAGEVYWLRGAAFAGWGPAGSAPDQATFAAYSAGARVLDPGQAQRLPQDPLKAAQMVAALPAPAPLPPLVSSRRKTRVGTTRILPITADQTFAGAATELAPPEVIRITGAEQPAPAPPPPSIDAPAAAPLTYYNYPVAQPASPSPPPEPAVVYVPEVVVVERERPRGGGQGHSGRRGDVSPPPASAAPAPAAPPPPAPAQAFAPHSAPAPKPAPKTEAPQEGPEHKTRLRSPESGDAPERRR